MDEHARDLYFRDGSEADPETWRQKQGDAEYVQVATDRIAGRFISTIWIGMDDGTIPSPDGRPLIFETVVFDESTKTSLDRARHADERAARVGHALMLAKWTRRNLVSRSKEFESQLRERHEAAVGILRAYEETRAPFVVCLRKFAFDVFHGPDDAHRALVEDTLWEDLPQSVGLITIMGEPGEMDTRQRMGNSPSLYIGTDDDWQEVLTPVLAAAEMVVSEFQFLSPGVRWELEACDRLGKALQTVIILPPQGSYLAYLDDLEPLDRFPRALWADRLFTERLSSNFAAADLVERLGFLASLSPEERREVYVTGQVRTRAPMSLRRLLDGHMAAAREWGMTRVLGEGDPRADYYYLWHWFRAAVVVGCLHKFEDVPLETLAFDFVYGYLEVLQGIAYGVIAVGGQGSFVTRDLVMKLASTVRTMMVRYPDQVGVLSSYADATFARLGIE